MSFHRPRYLPAGTVYGTLLNFRDECSALAGQMTKPPYKAPPQAPVLYIKTANTWSASGASIPVPPHVPKVEVGATVAMVMGAPGNAPHKAGLGLESAAFVLMNDLSIPHASFFRPPVRFKCLNGFLGIGAQLAGRRDVGDLSQLKLLVHVNGELRQTVNFSSIVRSAAELLADVSEFMTLRQGDVLMLGCDANRPLAKIGDRIDITAPGIPALGTLSNTLVAEQS